MKILRRHLLKPIRHKNEISTLVVVTGIKVAIDIAKIAYRVSKIGYKAVKKTRAGGRWIGRHPKALRYGSIAATAAPVIYDLMNIDYSAITSRKVRSTPVKQTRSYFQSSRSRQFGQPNCYPRYRNRRR